MSNKLEQLEFKLEKNIGIEEHAGKVRKSLISRTMSINFSLFNIKSRRHKRSHSAVPIPKNLKFFLIPFKFWIQKAFYPIMLWLLDCRGKKEKKSTRPLRGKSKFTKKLCYSRISNQDFVTCLKYWFLFTHWFLYN